jgi:hypothetical protein
MLGKLKRYVCSDLPIFWNLQLVSYNNCWRWHRPASHMEWRATTLATKTKGNFQGFSSTGQVLGLLPNNHEFKSSQGH